MIDEQLGFSALAETMSRFENKARQEELLRPTEPWTKAELSPERKAKRIANVLKDFWAFDKTYFEHGMYVQGYFKPSAFHKTIIEIAGKSGVNVILGPRDHAKTAMMKKYMVWRMMNGTMPLGGVYAETINKAGDMLKDLQWLIHNNAKLQADFDVELIVGNEDELTYRVGRNLTTVASFSEGRSVRGYTLRLLRPVFLLCDDVETLKSSMEQEQVEKRIMRLNESAKSLMKGANCVVLGNNFDERGALNRLLKMQKDKTIAKGWRVHVFKAWNGRPLWPAKFPAKNEAEMRAMSQSIDEADFQGNEQQNPIPRDGLIFVRQHTGFHSKIPHDAKGVIYVDPNLALKNKGDTTAIVRLLYSPSKELYYITFRCRSFDDPSKLLNATLEMMTDQVRGIAMDGHVSQEAHWTYHIRAWCAEHQSPYPRIEFVRYNVDELATNAQTIWQQGKFLFDEKQWDTEEGQRFQTQLFAFHTKKSKRKDDAPDGLICAYEYITRRKLVRRHSRQAGARPTIIIQDIY